MIQECLFVGGPADGERKLVDVHLTMILVSDCGPRDSLRVNPHNQVHTYRRSYAQASFKRSIIYFHESIAMTDEIESLIKNYNPRNETKKEIQDTKESDDY